MSTSTYFQKSNGCGKSKHSPINALTLTKIVGEFFQHISIITIIIQHHHDNFPMLAWAGWLSCNIGPRFLNGTTSWNWHCNFFSDQSAYSICYRSSLSRNAIAGISSSSIYCNKRCLWCSPVLDFGSLIGCAARRKELARNISRSATKTWLSAGNSPVISRNISSSKSFCLHRSTSSLLHVVNKELDHC